MEKVAIIYASTHHGNTRKLVDAIAQQYDITQIDADKQKNADLSEYDLIGFASGIDFGKFYDCVEQFVEVNLPKHKQIFFLYTCAKPNDRFTQSIKAKAARKHAVFLGEYGCKGYNTYGPWKLIGGMNKNHPSPKEVDGVIRFFESLLDEHME